jgi:hypothetical protein
MQRGEWDVEGLEERYGLGFGVYTIGGRRMIGHGGGFPGHITRTFVDPLDGLTVVVLTNAIDGTARGLAEGVVKLVDAALGAEADDAPADLASYTGRFAGLWGVTDVVDLGGRLRLVEPNQPDPTVLMTTLEVVDADTLRIDETAGYYAPGETIRYTRRDGVVEKVVFAGLTALPVEEHLNVLRGLDRIALGGAHAG